MLLFSLSVLWCLLAKVHSEVTPMTLDPELYSVGVQMVSGRGSSELGFWGSFAHSSGHLGFPGGAAQAVAEKPECGREERRATDLNAVTVSLMPSRREKADRGASGPQEDQRARV